MRILARYRGQLQEPYGGRGFRRARSFAPLILTPCSTHIFLTILKFSHENVFDGCYRDNTRLEYYWLQRTKKFEQKVPVSSNEQTDVEGENDSTWVPAFTRNGIHYLIFFGMNADIINQIIIGELDKLNNSYDITPEYDVDFVIE
jgi:hypothetical protein